MKVYVITPKSKNSAFIVSANNKQEAINSFNNIDTKHKNAFKTLGCTIEESEEFTTFYKHNYY